MGLSVNFCNILAANRYTTDMKAGRYFLGRTALTLILCAGMSSALPAPLFARTSDLEVAGWIPYWRAEQGIRDAQKHLDTLTAIHPFVYTVTNDGTLKGLSDLKTSRWSSLFKAAKRNHVQIIPTVMWSTPDSMHLVLGSPDTRKKHIAAIVALVKEGRFDGVDIDYEGKFVSTKDVFSLFLKELKHALGAKVLTCAIEPRTPADSLYAVVPDTIPSATDFAAVGTYCDRVEIMAYDQGRTDIKLDAQRKGEPYVPVADIDWVRKVITLAQKDIPKEKILIGVPTYGHEYEVLVSPEWYQTYLRQWSLNPSYALDVARKAGVTPSRNKAGEMSFSYLPDGMSLSFPSSLSIPADTSSGNMLAARTLAYANATGKSFLINVVWWSDAEAIRQKADLARELGLAGIALFKIDGGEDQKLWGMLR
jgi:spore germination protein YaaH